MTACLRFFCMGIKQTIKSLSCTHVHPTLVVTPWQGIISTLEITSRLHANLHSPCYWSDRRYKSLIWKVLKLMCNTNPSGEIRGPICPQGCKLTYGTTHFLYNLPTLRSYSKYTICTSSTNFLASAIPILNGDTLWLVAHCMTMPTREEWGRVHKQHNNWIQCPGDGVYERCQTHQAAESHFHTTNSLGFTHTKTCRLIWQTYSSPCHCCLYTSNIGRGTEMGIVFIFTHAKSQKCVLPSKLDHVLPDLVPHQSPTGS